LHAALASQSVAGNAIDFAITEALGEDKNVISK
jgi:hypothetical protein